MGVVQEGTCVSGWFGACGVGDRKHAGEFQAAHVRESQGAEGELVADSPARDKSDPESCFHGAQQAFGLIVSGAVREAISKNNRG